jgi:dihydropteroate synthase-like protein
MKILLVTGRKAADSLRELAVASGLDIAVHVCAVDVAALLSVNGILKELSGMKLSGVSLIMIPGNIKGDAKIISDKLGVECVKGPSNLADLPFVLEKITEKKVKKDLSAAYQKPNHPSIKIGNKKPVYLGNNVSHVMAEIIDAPLLSDDELIKKALYYVDSGAEIIDIGMCAGKNNAKKIPGIVNVLRSAVDVPLSVDSLDEVEILAALDAKIDLVLSIDETNKGLLGSINVPYVIIPRNAGGVVPSKAEERIKIVDGLLENSKKDAIVDLILSPINHGLTESLKAYSLFRENNPKTSLFFGAGNVTELFDVDSVGVNGLIAALASELTVDLILTTEASYKTTGSVRELRTAAEMMFLSKTRKQAPKDLGRNLLVLKEKRRFVYPARDYGVEKIVAKGPYKTHLEDVEFEIYLSDIINIVYYKKRKPHLHLTGRNASDLYNEVVSRKLLTQLDHAAYLGGELVKAEIALRLGKNYVQDRELF